MITKVNKMFKMISYLALLATLLASSKVFSQSMDKSETLSLVKEFQEQEKTEELPPILEVGTKRKYKILGNVGINDKGILQARESLRREAKKVSADALIAVICTPERIRRQGLTWSHEPAYCKGTAIAFESD